MASSTVDTHSGFLVNGFWLVVNGWLIDCSSFAERMFLRALPLATPAALAFSLVATAFAIRLFHRLPMD
jgi:hypothetical protein